MLPRGTIHLKVMVLIGLVLCLLLAITGYFALRNEKRFLLVEAGKRSRNLSHALEALTRLALSTGEDGPLREFIFLSAQEEKDLQSIVIRDPQGTVLYSTASEDGEVPALGLDSLPGPSVTDVYIDGHHAAQIEMVLGLEGLRGILERMTTLIILSVVDCLLFLGLVLHLALKYFVTRPLGQFQRLAREISGGQFGTHVDLKGDDELTDLASSFNRMSDSLAQQREELHEINRDLERRVEERTHQLVEEKRRSDRLSSLGTLSAGVAHELNNPLGNISTFTQLLLEKKDPPDQMLQRCLSTIESETRRAEGIVKQLLEFACQDTSPRQPVTAREVLEEALQLLAHTLEESKISVETVPDGAEGRILASRGSLVQVLVNFLTNAMHAMPEGGRLICGVSEEDATVRISVTDTGHGMTQEVQEQLFDPFFTTKDVGEGRGLGLSISHGIVTDHGGRIEVTSSPGQGSTFTMVLPAAEPGGR